MRGGTLDFVEHASQMRHDYHAQLCRDAGSHPASLVERRDHPIQRIVLTKKEDFVFPPEVVVKICRRKGRCRRNIPHAGLREPAYPKLSPRGAQDFQTPRKIASLGMAIALTLRLDVGQLDSPALERKERL